MSFTRFVPILKSGYSNRSPRGIQPDIAKHNPAPPYSTATVLSSFDDSDEEEASDSEPDSDSEWYGKGRLEIVALRHPSLLPSPTFANFRSTRFRIPFIPYSLKNRSFLTPSSKAHSSPASWSIAIARQRKNII